MTDPAPRVAFRVGIAVNDEANDAYRTVAGAWGSTLDEARDELVRTLRALADAVEQDDSVWDGVEP